MHQTQNESLCKKHKSLYSLQCYRVCTILSVFKVLLGFPSKKISPDSLKESIILLIIDAEIPAFFMIVHWETLFLSCWIFWPILVCEQLSLAPCYTQSWYYHYHLNLFTCGVIQTGFMYLSKHVDDLSTIHQWLKLLFRCCVW